MKQIKPIKPIQPIELIKPTKRSPLCCIICAVGLMFALFTSASAQQVPQQISISSSPNPVGSGARAVGMGGAFIAVADDATAASWNPAGLTQLRKPEFSFVFSHFKRREDFNSHRHPEAEGMQEVSTDDINFMSAAYPFTLLKRNMIVSLNYQLLYDFDRDLEFGYLTQSVNPASGSVSRAFQKVDFRQRGSLKALSPAYAVQITPDLSLGVTCNIWTDQLFWSNGWESTTHTEGYIGRAGKAPTKFKTRDHDRYTDFSGFNMHIGFLWRVNSFLSIGGVVKTPFTADIKHRKVFQSTIYSPTGQVTRGKMKINENVDLDMPLSYGLGAALRFTDEFTVSFDVFHTEWSHYILEDGKGVRMNPVTGKRSHLSHVKDTNQVRLGAEYLFVLTKTVIPVRAGIFYDPEPSEKHPEDYWGFSLGTGISIGKVVFDIAYQYRTGDDVGLVGIPATKADMTQHLLLGSVIYHF